MHAPTQSATPDLVPVKRALLSVSDKTGIADFARALQTEFNVELVSTGGTAKALRDAGLKVADISDVTGFPEMMDGRVKTLHPKIHGGFLALRDNPDHLAAMQQHDIQPIDLVCVNLYPFEATIARPECSFEQAIENIDIGGPAMIRSASKNHRSIVVVTDPIQYEKVLKHMRNNKTAAGEGQTPYKFRLDLAMWAYTRTAQYDAAIYPYLAHRYFSWHGRPAHDLGGGPQPITETEKPNERAGLLPALTPRLQKVENLRYGENPHQLGAFYSIAGNKEPGIATARQFHGKALSYINILDADAAIELVREFPQPAAAVIKHTNPCGCAIGETLAEAFDKAYAGDPIAAFGGIVALNRDVDERTAEEIVSGKRFLEVIIAPGYAAPALEMLKDRWKDCRILATGNLDAPRDIQQLHYRSVTGGILVQQRDLAGFDRAACTVTSNRQPTASEWTDLAFVWLVTKHVKSNAIAIAKDGQLLAAGAGQMSRPMSAKIAIELAQKNGHAATLPGSAAGSDAFFPFPDAPELLITAGITAIIHPGGSKKDQDTIDLCNRHNIALVTTGQRHFAH
ncbi:MAG TPA: bifunctional phosphoribosylaminoimidazolecarboxamide formyltransferase/IMP cyclohydrolase [Phycisphaerae bacterium]|nr:bifunctional phosphoribosylaminoimidazolecarboxamide formyltransferase/IMP cyclohydrolase [Phycisphaerae bacterium]